MSRTRDDRIPGLSVIIPAFNEEHCLPTTIATMLTVLDQCGQAAELIVVDDGSTDRTGELLDDLAAREPRLRAVHLERNQGIGHAFTTGLRYVRMSALTWLPADGENNLDEVLTFLPFLEQVDIVVPFVQNRGVRSLQRRIISSAYLWSVNISFGTVFAYTNGTIVYRREVFDQVRPTSRGFFIHAECLIKAIRAGFTFVEVPVKLEPRSAGHSKALRFRSAMQLGIDYATLFASVHVLKTSGQVTTVRENP
ncbi:MAG: hypothetical protein A2284_03160 [Deltaproteobacteria bacterium RIFOXYA12_FULL_61_11]|nr:MAG: hypothetical protein A2284_03160 [Deltaproteobacteria bacterium RIFOXYA12_FULL_61_11]